MSALAKEPTRIVGRLYKERFLSGETLVERSKFIVMKSKSNCSLRNVIDDVDFDIQSLDFASHKPGVYEIVAVGDHDDYELQLVEFNIK